MLVNSIWSCSKLDKFVDWQLTGYGLNVYLPPSKKGDDWLTGAMITCPSLRSIKSPSETILFGDTMGSLYYPASGDWHLCDAAETWAVTWEFGYIHNGKANMAFVDGHVVPGNLNYYLDLGLRAPITLEGSY